MCNGERAKQAAIYPFALCRAILRGFRDQMVADGRLQPGSVGLNCVMLDGGDERLVETRYIAGDADGNVLKLNIASDEKFVDDLTGHALDRLFVEQLAKRRWTSLGTRGFG